MRIRVIRGQAFDSAIFDQYRGMLRLFPLSVNAGSAEIDYHDFGLECDGG